MKRIDEEIKNKFANDKHRFLANLIFTSNWFKNQFTEFLKPYGLSQQQFNILRILRGAGDWLNMHELKQRMVDKAPNATRLSDKLIDKKLIIRRRSETDRRVVYLKITEEGLQLLTEIDQDDSQHFVADLLDKLSEEECKMVNEVLDKFRS